MALIEIKDDFNKISEALQKLEVFASKPAPILEALGDIMVENTKERFDKGESPDGEKWVDLNPLYAAHKEGGPGILQGKTHSLQDTLVQHVSGEKLSWGSNLIYAAVHQFGATIVPVKAQALVFMMGGTLHKRKSVTIPARPYLGFTKEDEGDCLETLKKHFLGCFKD